MAAHDKRETDTLDHHQELVRDIGQIEEQRDLFRADISALENVFDDLHKRYLKLKHVHQTLAEEKQQLEARHAELETWNKKASDQVQKIKQNLQTKNEEYDYYTDHFYTRRFSYNISTWGGKDSIRASLNVCVIGGLTSEVYVH